MQLFNDNDCSLAEDSLMHSIDTLHQNINGRIDHLLHKWIFNDISQTDLNLKSWSANYQVCSAFSPRVMLGRWRGEAAWCSASDLYRSVCLSVCLSYLRMYTLCWYLLIWRRGTSEGGDKFSGAFPCFLYCFIPLHYIIISAANEIHDSSSVNTRTCKMFAQNFRRFKDPWSSSIDPSIELLVAE